MPNKKIVKRKATGFHHAAPHGFHLMAKPAGPRCNLGCVYCFYREKETFFHGSKNFVMGDEVLEAYIREYIQSQPGPSAVFDWQGGEPALLGIGFFE